MRKTYDQTNFTPTKRKVCDCSSQTLNKHEDIKREYKKKGVNQAFGLTFQPFACLSIYRFLSFPLSYTYIKFFFLRKLPFLNQFVTLLKTV